MTLSHLITSNTGSLAHSIDGTEVWIRPLSDGTFAAVLLNKLPIEAVVTLNIASNAYNGGDFYPASFPAAKLRNVYEHKDLGLFVGIYSTLVPAYDAVILKVYPIAGDV